MKNKRSSKPKSDLPPESSRPHSQLGNSDSGEVCDIALTELKVDTALQCRAKLDHEAITEYAERNSEKSQPPPITVYNIENVLYVVDGFHRYRAAEKAGASTIKAIVRIGSFDAAFRYALTANDVHGIRVTNEDKRHRVGMARVRWPKKSNRAIAVLCGVSSGLVDGIVKGRLPKIGSRGPEEVSAVRKPKHEGRDDGRLQVTRRAQSSDKSEVSGGRRAAALASVSGCRAPKSVRKPERPRSPRGNLDVRDLASEANASSLSLMIAEKLIQRRASSETVSIWRVGSVLAEVVPELVEQKRARCEVARFLRTIANHWTKTSMHWEVPLDEVQLNITAGPDENATALLFGTLVVEMVVKKVRAASGSCEPSGSEDQFCARIAKLALGTRIPDCIARLLSDVASRLEVASSSNAGDDAAQ